MTKQKMKESQKEQSARFERAVRDMIDAGVLSPTEADTALEKAIKRLSPEQDEKDA